MIAQIVFSCVLVSVILVAFTQLARLPLVGGLVITVSLFGAYLVWMPESATQIAHYVGIGRGTDLVLYIWVLISFCALLVLYLVVRGQLQLITALARRIALVEAAGIAAVNSRDSLLRDGSSSHQQGYEADQPNDSR